MTVVRNPLTALAAGLLLSLTVWAATPEVIPTGMKITPTAAPGSTFQALNPGLPDYPAFIADHAVATVISPAGNTLLVLTTGFNQNYDTSGNVITDQSNEYVFVFDISGKKPVQKQVLQIPNTFNGIAFSPTGQQFYVSGGVNDNVHTFTFGNGSWSETGLPIALNHAGGHGLVTPAQASGLAVNAAGTRLLVANYENDSVTLIDLAQGTVLQELDLRPGKNDPSQTGVPGGSYPFWVVFKGNNKAYVSSVRNREVDVLNVTNTGASIAGRIALTGRPNKMTLNGDQSLLFVALDNTDQVAVVDTASDSVDALITTTDPADIGAGKGGKPAGGAPTSVALSPDENTLYVTNGGINSVGVIALNNHGIGGGTGIGQIPTGWYPTSVSVSKDGKTLFVTNGKSNAGPNPEYCNGGADPNQPQCNASEEYIWQLTKAGFSTIPVPKGAVLQGLTNRVASNANAAGTPNANDENLMSFLRSKVHHVIYIVRENRTYDQVLGDLGKGNGDPNLAILGEPLTPNQHQLASQFVTLDNFFDSGEVSSDGWNWTTAARATDQEEKQVPVNYAGRGLSYDNEGTNRNIDVALPTIADRIAANPALQYIPPPQCNGCTDPDLMPGTEDDGGGIQYLWDNALNNGLSVRNYGFYLDLVRYELPSNLPGFIPPIRNAYGSGTVVAFPAKPVLLNTTDLYYSGFDMRLPDFWRVNEWEREFQQNVKNGDLPNLTLLRLPHDHTGSFGTAIDGVNTVETQTADNDYAVGRVIEDVAHSPYAKDTLIFVIEDDAQDGADHVDAHRSVAFVAGPYVRRDTVVSTRYNTVNMIRTIEDILGLPAMNLNDQWIRPMSAVFHNSGKSWDYQSIVPSILYTTQLPLPPADKARVSRPYTKPLHNAQYWSDRMRGMNFTVEDKLDTPRYNKALWEGLKGENVPYPAVRDGRNLRHNRKQRLEQYLQAEAKRQTKQVADLSKPASSGQ